MTLPCPTRVQSRSIPDQLQVAPLGVGLYQFNLVAPNVAASDAVPVSFTLGGTPGAQTLYSAIGD